MYTTVPCSLCWCLEGKSSEFYASIMSRNQATGFQEIFSKLEKRFGGVPFPDTAQAQLANLRNLSKIRWTIRAFPELSEEYMYQQTVKRICHGCVDKEAGQFVMSLNLDPVELVIEIRSFFSVQPLKYLC
jgi:hypothetical protein